MKIKTSYFIVGLLLVLVVGSVILFSPDNLLQHKKQETMNNNQSKKEQLAILNQYPSIANILETEDSASLIPIPGLKATKTFNDKGKVSICDAMTPQGLTLSDDYLLISAYCHDHLHHSVIYVLDGHSHELLRTAVLMDTSHAGGLGFDANKNNVWVSTTGGVAAITLSDILTYEIEDKRPVRYYDNNLLLNINRSSVMTVFNNFLIVGNFKKQTNGKLTLYAIDQSGKLSNSLRIPTDETNSANPLYYTSETLSINKIQGIAFYQNYVLLSQSYGKQNSKLYIFDKAQNKGNLKISEATYTIEFPPYLEQITVKDGYLYAVFESGAKAYRHKTSKVVDYIIRIPFDELLNQEEQQKL